jgi:hypothetical protein
LIAPLIHDRSAKRCAARCRRLPRLSSPARFSLADNQTRVGGAREKTHDDIYRGRACARIGGDDSQRANPIGGCGRLSRTAQECDPDHYACGLQRNDWLRGLRSRLCQGMPPEWRQLPVCSLLTDGASSAITSEAARSAASFYLRRRMRRVRTPSPRRAPPHLPRRAGPLASVLMR